MDILVFGGTFDPPHIGHLALLEAGLKELPPARAVILPAWRSPFKARPGASGTEREGMARALLAALPAGLRRRAAVDPWELRQRRTVYTFESLRRLRSLRPGAGLWFLAGTDALRGLPRWRRAAEVRSLSRWLVGLRPGEPLPAGRGLPDYRPLRHRMPDVSSTEVRARLAADEGAAGLIPRKVLSVIESRGLYHLAARRELRRRLRPRRYRHTLAVARLARRLARLHGLDQEEAAAAGLLHDCGRAVPAPRMASYALRRRLPVPGRAAILRNAPILLHAYISADLAERRFGVSDRRVLSAIRNHTLGKPGMGALDRLLYVADAASEDRRFPEAERIRRAALRDLDSAFLAAARMKRRYARASGGWVHPATERLCRWAERTLS